MSQLRGHFFFPVVRALERFVSVNCFRWLLTPSMRLRAAFHGIYRGAPAPLPYPDCLRLPPPAPDRLQFRLPLYISRVLEMIPDRLSRPQWRERCRFAGFEAVKQAQAAGRPVVFAFAHFGGYRLLRPWLRAAGIPVAILVAAPLDSRSRLLRKQDRLALFPEVPLAFDSRQLAAAMRFLEAGNCLAVAVDVPTGRQTTVSLADGWTMRMAAGPVRMARRHEAELIPCSVIDESGWRYRFEFGEPTPRALLEDPSDQLAAQHLLEQFLPLWKHHPAQWTEQLCQCFQPPAQYVPATDPPTPP